MIKSFKEAWNKIQQDPPGKRFRRQYRRRQSARESIVNRLLFISIGLICILAGITMLFIPGPGIVFILVGWGLVAQESLWLAILLDKLEIYLREWIDWGEKVWENASFGLKFIITTGILIITTGALYIAYLLFVA